MVIIAHLTTSHWLKALAIVALIGRPSEAATSRQIQDAIDRARSYLYSQQNAAGTWEESSAPVGGKESFEPSGGQWGGLTALATYSLLASGDRPRDPRLHGAIEFLKTAPIKGIYAIGLRAQIWTYLPPGGSVHNAIARDGALLLGAVKHDGAARGMYGYLAGGVTDSQHIYDHSVSQYGVLGMWALQEAGLEVPDQYWADVDAAWRREQLAEGGWSYYGQPQTPYPQTVSMTAAGVATLFLTDDYLRAASGLQCRDNLADADIERGLNWIGGHFDTTFAVPNRACYALYGIERIGAASGRKTFGEADWWQRGADFLIDRQSADSGAWDQGDGKIADTAFGLLFLVRGRAPVVVNKLDYSSAAIGAAWNRRPRDAAHLSRWISKTIEAQRPLNWQVASLADDPDNWHDAPILLLCGREALRFSDEQQGKLKRFVEDGGLILANADCAGSQPFTDSVRQLGRQLFEREFRPLPANHPIYVSEEFHRNQWRNPPMVWGLTNGVRELMILIPDGDIAAAWQVNSPLVRPEAFELGANIFLYAVDKENLRFKGESYRVKADPAVTATRQIKIARLDCGDGGDPEPGGWRRLAAVMHNRDEVDLQVSTIRVGRAGSVSLDNSFAVAHLTGTTAFSLSPAARDELRRFVEDGGTLIIDAAGGSRAFGDSAQGELAEIFGDKAAQLQTPLAIEDDFYSGAVPAIHGRDIEYRAFARTVLGDVRHPRLRAIHFGGRIGVYFSAEDLSCGLVGQPVDGIVGYTPELATRLMERMVLGGERK